MLTWCKAHIVQHPIIGIERRRPVRARQRRVIRRQVAHLAVRQHQRVRFVFKTRKNPGLHQEGDVGKVTSPRREIVTTSDSGQVNVRKDKDPPHLAPLHLIRVALDLRRHRRKDSGRPVKVPPACVHRLHPIQEIGGQDGDRLLATEIDSP